MEPSSTLHGIRIPVAETAEGEEERLQMQRERPITPSQSLPLTTTTNLSTDTGDPGSFFGGERIEEEWSTESEENRVKSKKERKRDQRERLESSIGTTVDIETSYYEETKEMVKENKQKQKRLSKLLLRRLHTSRRTVKGIAAFLKEISEIEVEFGRKMADIPSLHGLGDIGTVEDTLKALTDLTSKQSKVHYQVGKMCLKEVVPQLEHLKDEMKYEEDVHKWREDVKEAEGQFNKAYSSMISKTKDAQKQAKKHLHGLKDPFIPLNQVYKEATHLDTIMARMNLELEKLFDTVGRMEETRVGIIRNSLGRIINERDVLHESLGKRIDQCVKSLQSTQSDFIDFSLREGLVVEGRTFKEVSLPHRFVSATYLNPVTNEITDIRGEFELEDLQEKKWHKYQGVVTKFGWLYWFNVSEKTDTSEADKLNLFNCNLTRIDSSRHVIILEETHVFKANKQYVLRVHEEEFSKWKNVLKMYAKVKDEKEKEKEKEKKKKKNEE